MKHTSDLPLKRRETETRSLLLITYVAADYFSKYPYCPERRVRTNISVAQISGVCVRATKMVVLKEIHFLFRSSADRQH